MEITTIIITTGIIIAIIMGLKIIKTALKTIIYIIGIIAITALIIGITSYKDINTIKTSLEKQKTIAYEEGNKIITAIRISNPENNEEENKIKILKEKEKKELEEKISKGTIKNLTIIITNKAINKKGITINNNTISKEQIEETMRTGNEEEKSTLLLAIITTKIKEEGMKGIIKEIEEENIKIYPEMKIKEILKIIPETIKTKIISEEINNTE